MEKINNNSSKLFFGTAFVLLLIGLVAGVLSSFAYLFPNFFIEKGGLLKLRPIHVSAVMFWIIIGATATVYTGLWQFKKSKTVATIAIIQWVLWIIALVGISYSYWEGDFGGREYWEFNPIWAIPIFLAFSLFLVAFFLSVKQIKIWPVYIWMWMTGIVFFLFIFIENYLWIFPYFRSHFVSDMTLQWKVNGSMIGSFNQLLYGSAFFLMDYINKGATQKVAFSKLAFGLYFLGLANLMFNWGHHIYTLPTDSYVRIVAYVISMTEWVFFVKIIYNWKKSFLEIKSNYHYFPFRFLMATDFWIFVNMGQAILMSIPAFNIYTHGTHVTVAHSMGTTIGINSMIIFAAAFTFLGPVDEKRKPIKNILNVTFWISQVALLCMFVTLDYAGFLRGMWQMSKSQIPFFLMMEQSWMVFAIIGLAGLILLICFFVFIYFLFTYLFKRSKSTTFQSCIE